VDGTGQVLAKLGMEDADTAKTLFKVQLLFFFIIFKPRVE
jgi:hypothetical protein